MYCIYHAENTLVGPQKWVSLIRDGGGIVIGFKYEQKQDATKIDNYTAASILRDQLEKVSNKPHQFFVEFVE